MGGDFSLPPPARPERLMKTALSVVLAGVLAFACGPAGGVASQPVQLESLPSYPQSPAALLEVRPGASCEGDLCSATQPLQTAVAGKEALGGLSYSTYLFQGLSQDVAVDGQGNAYVIGLLDNVTAPTA